MARLLEFEPWRALTIEPLMGWTSSDDPYTQIRLTFPTLTAAGDYAGRQGLDYVVVEPNPRRSVRNSYRDTIVATAPVPGLRSKHDT